MTKNKLITLALLSTLLLVLLSVFFFRRSKDISIEPLIQYAKNTRPCQEQLNDSTKWIFFCVSPPLPPDDVINVLDNRVIDSLYIKWVLIVYLKLCQDQFKLYHQSFDCRDEPFIYKRFAAEQVFNRAFCEIVGKTYFGKKTGPEFLSALSAYLFIEENKLFANDLEVRHEMKLTE